MSTLVDKLSKNDLLHIHDNCLRTASLDSGINVCYDDYRL